MDMFERNMIMPSQQGPQHNSLGQRSGTCGSRARCGSFDDGIWLASYFLNTIVTNETFSAILHLPD